MFNSLFSGQQCKTIRNAAQPYPKHRTCKSTTEKNFFLCRGAVTPLHRNEICSVHSRNCRSGCSCPYLTRYVSLAARLRKA